MTDQPITPADEQVRPVDTDGIEYGVAWLRGEIGSADPERLAACADAIEALTRPSPVVDALAAELAAVEPFLNDRRTGSYRISVDLRDRILTALAMRPAPETTGDVLALQGYRAAAAYIAADSWDGCSDCIEILRAARATDVFHPAWTPDETAYALRALRQKMWGPHGDERLAANLPKPTEQATSPAPDAVLREALEAARADLHWAEQRMRAFRDVGVVRGACPKRGAQELRAGIARIDAALASSKPTGEGERWITVWRKTGEKMLEWDFHTSDFAEDVPRVVANLKSDGVRQYSTYRLGALVPEHTALEYHPAAIRSGDKAEGEASLRARTEEKGHG